MRLCSNLSPLKNAYSSLVLIARSYSQEVPLHITAPCFWNERWHSSLVSIFIIEHTVVFSFPIMLNSKCRLSWSNFKLIKFILVIYVTWNTQNVQLFNGSWVFKVTTNTPRWGLLRKITQHTACVRMHFQCARFSGQAESTHSFRYKRLILCSHDNI